MANTVKKLTRRVRRLATLTPLAMWGWKYRHELAGVLGMAKRAPKQAISGGTKDLVTEARVRHALAREELTRGNHGVQVLDVLDGEVHLRSTSPSAEAVARSVAEFVPGVKRVSTATPAGAVR